MAIPSGEGPACSTGLKGGVSCRELLEMVCLSDLFWVSERSSCRGTLAVVCLSNCFPGAESKHSSCKATLDALCLSVCNAAQTLPLAE
jgi:hypothetical protein